MVAEEDLPVGPLDLQVRLKRLTVVLPRAVRLMNLCVAPSASIASRTAVDRRQGRWLSVNHAFDLADAVGGEVGS